MSFLSSLFSSAQKAESTVSKTASVAGLVLQVAAAVSPVNSEKLLYLSDKVKTDTAAAQSLLHLVNDHADSIDAKQVVVYGIDALSIAQPQYSAFLQLLKPIVVDSDPLAQSLLKTVINSSLSHDGKIVESGIQSASGVVENID